MELEIEKTLEISRESTMNWWKYLLIFICIIVCCALVFGFGFLAIQSLTTVVTTTTPTSNTPPTAATPPEAPTTTTKARPTTTAAPTTTTNAEDISNPIPTRY